MLRCEKRPVKKKQKRVK